MENFVFTFAVLERVDMTLATVRECDFSEVCYLCVYAWLCVYVYVYVYVCVCV